MIKDTNCFVIVTHMVGESTTRPYQKHYCTILVVWKRTWTRERSTGKGDRGSKIQHSYSHIVTAINYVASQKIEWILRIMSSASAHSGTTMQTIVLLSYIDHGWDFIVNCKKVVIPEYFHARNLRWLICNTCSMRWFRLVDIPEAKNIQMLTP